MRNHGDVVDVLVVGGGHAGCEAALACARLGLHTLLVTGSIDRIAAMSCNPAIGGVGKGHLVKELDVLGGEMGRVADQTGIHFRTLNESRGPAVRATRCQSDMERYRQMMSTVVAKQARLRVRQDDVVALVHDGTDAHGRPRVTGVRTRHGEVLLARHVILTTGTFMGGLLHRGEERLPGGRAGEAPAAGLSSSLAALDVRLARLKTGTCPRVDARTIRYEALEEQRPDNPAPRFSWDENLPMLPQVSCFLTHTTKHTHAVIQDAVAAGRSPLFSGQIQGRGPRYCPSLEDKVMRFADKDSHLIFLEPHGLDTHEVYPNGLSTSLPPDVQLAFLRTIPGLEDVEVTRWGYAVEYDFVDPTQLTLGLMCRDVAGLSCAGQINGTTGYEEAAMQGLLAGINAAHALLQKPALVLQRDQAYAGVLVDDLVGKGTDEPYRMFTSRAEHRLLLREDNVTQRLLPASLAVGLASQARLERMQQHEQDCRDAMDMLAAHRVMPTPEVQSLLEAAGTHLREPVAALQLLKRPEVDWRVLMAVCGLDLSAQVGARINAEVKYAGYVSRVEDNVARERALEDETLPASVFDARLPGLSAEVFEKLQKLRPQTLGQASRIGGVTPAAIGLLAIEARRRAASSNA
jgi:tRNA uridine 5-carboxymethylaminomethyl modification enzyme